MKDAENKTNTPPELDKVPPAAVYIDAHNSTDPGRMAGLPPSFRSVSGGICLSFAASIRKKLVAVKKISCMTTCLSGSAGRAGNAPHRGIKSRQAPYPSSNFPPSGMGVCFRPRQSAHENARWDAVPGGPGNCWVRVWIPVVRRAYNWQDVGNRGVFGIACFLVAGAWKLADRFP